MSTELWAFFRDPNLQYVAELRIACLTCKLLRNSAHPILFYRAKDGLRSRHFASALRRDPELTASVNCLVLKTFSPVVRNDRRMTPVSFSIFNESREYIHGHQAVRLNSLGLNHTSEIGIACLSLANQFGVLCIEPHNAQTLKRSDRAAL